MKIPFPKGIVGLDIAPKLQEYLLNLFISRSGVVRTPGIDSFGTGVGTCRGAETWRNGKAYMVSGNSLISIASTGAITNLGTISGTADCVFSLGQVNIVIIVKGGDGYYYNETNGLQQITDTDFLPSASVDFIDGRHVFIPADGSPAFYTEIDNPNSISPLAFFDAEELPDKNKAVINTQNQLIILGDDSAEIFRTNVNPDVVFSRREGSRIDYGFIGGLVRFGNTFAFVGRKRGEAAQIFVMGSGRAEPISSEAVDQLINKEYTGEERAACEAYRYVWDSYEVLVFTFARHTLKFVNGQWVYSSSELNDSVQGQWRVKGICYAYGHYIVGDRDNSKIGKLSDSATEYGEDVEFEVQTYIRDEKNTYFDVNAITLDNLTGQSDTEQTISLRLSKDGRTYYDPIPRSLGLKGEYAKQITWQPVGQVENFLGMKLRSTAPVKFGMESIQAT